MKKCTMKAGSVLTSVLGLALVTACSSMNSKDGGAPLGSAPGLGKAESPFVEAFLEYVGPPQKWAGPGSFVVHIVAKDNKAPKVVLYPALLPARPVYAPAVHPSRALAGTEGKSPQYTTEVAREQLQELARLMAEGQNFSACLYPIRVRLIRGDGSVMDRYGCRSREGWPAMVSRMMSDWIQVAVSQESAAPRVAQK